MSHPQLDFVGQVPEARGEEATYFAYCQDEDFRIQRCSDCSTPIFYPRSVCPICFGRELEWVRAEGTGSVHTFTIHYREPPGFEGQAPYVVAIVELNEGVRMLSRLIAEPDDVYVGMPVQATFATIADGFKVPVFTPARGARE